MDGLWLRSHRRAQGWDVPQLARRVAAAAGEDRSTLPDHETLTGYIRRWEARRAGISERYELLLAKAFSLDRGEPDVSVPAPPPAAAADDVVDMAELARHAERSDLGRGTLEALHEVKERLCRDYPSWPAEELARRAARHSRHVLGLLDGRVSLAQHRELLVTSAWLAALLGCLHYDLGNTGAAEAARVMAGRLGEEAGHGEIVAWSCELAAWFALVEGRHADTVRWAQAGADKAGQTGAAVQLALQAARGYAQMGDDRAIRALRTARRILERLPPPAYPEHHFAVDRDKYDFYAGTTWAWLGTDDATAAKHLRLAAAKCVLPSGRVRWPMRLAMSRLDLAMLASRRGDLDEAVALGRAALEIPRRSALLLPRAAEFGQRLATRYPREQLVREYRDLVRSTRSAPPPRAWSQGSGPRSSPSASREDARRTRRLPARPGSAARSQAGGARPPIRRPRP
jgi:hypothetical protein